MCRWFAYIAPQEECLLEDVLVTPTHGIAKQVHDHYLPKLISHTPGEETTEDEITLRNRLLNVDGFGIAWYTNTRSSFISAVSGPRPTFYKNSQPPTKDPYFSSICANTSTTALFAHIRAATGTPVVSINNHPFIFGRHTIMHNGEISDFAAIRRDLLTHISPAAAANIRGTTDSEHLAALYMTHLAAANPSSPAAWDQTYPLANMHAALTATINTIMTLQRALVPDPASLAASSLNVCITNGLTLLACRFRDHVTEQPPSLYYSATAGVTLNRKYPDTADGPDSESRSESATTNPLHKTLSADMHGAHVIVASEPSTYHMDDWSVIEKNHALAVDERGRYSVNKLVVDEGWFATGKMEGKSAGLAYL